MLILEQTHKPVEVNQSDFHGAEAEIRDTHSRSGRKIGEPGVHSTRRKTSRPYRWLPGARPLVRCIADWIESSDCDMCRRLRNSTPDSLHGNFDVIQHMTCFDDAFETRGGRLPGLDVCLLLLSLLFSL